MTCDWPKLQGSMHLRSTLERPTKQLRPRYRRHILPLLRQDSRSFCLSTMQRRDLGPPTPLSIPSGPTQIAQASLRSMGFLLSPPLKVETMLATGPRSASRLLYSSFQNGRVLHLMILNHLMNITLTVFVRVELALYFLALVL